MLEMKIPLKNIHTTVTQFCHTSSCKQVKQNKEYLLFAAVDHKVGEVNWFPATFLMPVDRGYRTQLHVFIFVVFQAQVCWTAHKYWVTKKIQWKISYIDTQQSYLIQSNYWNCECQSAINGIGSQLAIKNGFCTSKIIWHGKATFYL